jgi:poly-beta-hydroxyalkanoate depolymerase
MVNRRDFKKNPVTEEELMHSFWYPVVDDMIGGYAVCTVDKFTSELNHYEGEFEVASFMSLQCAKHIADLHNDWWNSYIWESYSDNIMMYYNRTLDEAYESEAIRKSPTLDSMRQTD